MIATNRTCTTVPKRNRQQPCGGRLTWAVAQAGPHEGQWIEACFTCGSERVLNDHEIPEQALGNGNGAVRP